MPKAPRRKFASSKYNPMKGTKMQISKKKTMYRPSPKYNLPANQFSTGAEVKAIDIAEISTVFQTPGGTVPALLNGIQTGAGYFNRVGARIEMKYLKIRGVINNIATTASADIGRICIVYDRQPAPGAIPAATVVFQSRDQTGTGTTNTGFSEINLDYRERFSIVRDYQVYLPNVTNAAGAGTLTNGPSFPGEGQPLDINMYIPLKGLNTMFKSSSNPTTIADVATGALYIYCLAYTTAAWTFTWQARLRYDDK